jgi:hypothetical protein
MNINSRMGLPEGEKVPEGFLVIPGGASVVVLAWVVICWRADLGCGECACAGERERGSRGGGITAGGLILEEEELCRINLGVVLSTCDLPNFSLNDNSKLIKVPFVSTVVRNKDTMHRMPTRRSSYLCCYHTLPKYKGILSNVLTLTFDTFQSYL